MQFDYSIEHTPGKFLYTADVLSRSPLLYEMSSEAAEQQEDVEYCTSQLPASSERLSTFVKHNQKTEHVAESSAIVSMVGQVNTKVPLMEIL